MKNLILTSLFIFLFSAFVRSEATKFGDEVIWRSSITNTTETSATIATGTVVMKVKIQSAGSSDAYVKVYSNGVLKDYLDGTNNNGETFLTYYSTPTYSNYGSTPAYIKFYWDWTQAVPEGQAGKGR